MPLITGARPAPPAPQVDVRYPLQVTYIDPDGDTWPWSDPTSGIIITGVTGIGSPPASYADIALPGGGSLAQSYTAAARQIVIGLHVFDEESQDGLLDLIDRLARALWTERAGIPAPGALVFTRPDGRARQIDVYCTSGPEHADEDATRDAYQWSTNYGLTFVSALDPMFQDTVPVGPIAFEPAPSGGGVPPMPPVLLKPKSTLGTTQVVNEGNGDAYPIWTITGPGTPTLTNVTTGRSFGLDVALGSGETVTVDTRPARQSAVDQLGNDRWGDLVRASPRDLWVLPVGTSDLELEIAGSGVGSKIELSYVRRWLRA